MRVGLLLAAALTCRLARSGAGSDRPSRAVAQRGREKCKAARIVSEGWKNYSYIGQADFYLDGERIDFPTGRGVNVVTIDPGTQEILSQDTYDTWQNRSIEDHRLARDLEALPFGRIILVSVKDDGMERLDPIAEDALRSVGATEFEESFRAGYALISRKGSVAVAERCGVGGEVVEVNGKLPCLTCATAKVVANSSMGASPIQFFIDGEPLRVSAGAGLNMVVVDSLTQKLADFKRYVPESRIDAAVAEGTNFAASVYSMAQGTIVLIAVWPASPQVLDDATLMALRWLGAEAPSSIANGGGYVFIGSKDGWAIAETSGSSGHASVEERLPCVLEDTSPREVPFPGRPFPGRSATDSNAAWPSGRQPEPFGAWPQSTYTGALESCWKTRVLRDSAHGTLGGCRGLAHSKVESRDVCRATCAQQPDCTLWHFDGKAGCFQGVGSDCNDLGVDTPVDVDKDSQQLQHGDVRVLKALRGVQILGLRSLGELSDPSFESVVRCRDWCYSNINCQYWQYGSRGCFVEDPQQGAVAQYPLTLQGGAEASSDLAKSMLAGEYIQHFCPPKPLGVREAAKDLPYVEGAAIWWNGSLVLGRRSAAAWAPQHGAAPLPAWPEGPDGRPLPCRKTKVLEKNARGVGGWPGGCLELVNLTNLGGASCRNTCLYNASCSSWLLIGDSELGACYHGAGTSCGSSALTGWKSLAHWTGERIQHGEVQVLKDISTVEIYNLYNMGRCPDGAGECLERCRDWCYSNVRCRYWQFRGQSCLVDAIGEGAPAYASGLAGALSSAKMGQALIAGEYVRHFCRSQDILRDDKGLEVEVALARMASGAQGLAAQGLGLAQRLRRWPFNVVAIASLAIFLAVLFRGPIARRASWVAQAWHGDARAPAIRWCASRDPYSYSACPCIQEETYEPWHPPKSKRAIVVLEKVPLEALASDKAEQGSSLPVQGSPDIRAAYECFAALLSSALFRAGRLQVFLHSTDDALLEVHPSVHPPATLWEFKILLTTALRQREVHGKAGGFQHHGPLMRTLKPPVKRYLPPSCSCFALSTKGRRANLDELAEDADASSRTMVFAIGVLSGDDVREQAFGAAYAPDAVAICPFSVKPVEVCKLVTQELQQHMGIHDPPLDADVVEAPLRLDIRQKLGP